MRKPTGQPLVMHDSVQRESPRASVKWFMNLGVVVERVRESFGIGPLDVAEARIIGATRR